MFERILGFDFDSSFYRDESLDRLAREFWKDDPEAEAKISEFSHITSSGMNSGLGFKESLTRRMAMIKPHQDLIGAMVDRVLADVSPSIKRNRAFFEEYAEQIYIISGGFHELIDPVARAFGISENHVFANHFDFDEHGFVKGFKDGNVMATDDGKVEVVRSLNVSKEMFDMLGEGSTDLAVGKAGLGRYFYFGENVNPDLRPAVARHPLTTSVLRDFDDYLRFVGYRS